MYQNIMILMSGDIMEFHQSNGVMYEMIMSYVGRLW